jgi:outer membrane immunogenic protein
MKTARDVSCAVLLSRAACRQGGKIKGSLRLIVNDYRAASRRCVDFRKGPVMRSLLVLSLAVFGFAQSAFAADPAEDMPYLRGSNVYEPPAYRTYTRWSGFYVGGQAGYSSANVTYGTRAKQILINVLADTPLPGQSTMADQVPILPDQATGKSYGAFAGYNWQWEDVVLSVEGNYNHSSVDSLETVSAWAARPVFNGFGYIANLSATSGASLSDYVTLRGRAGYAMGSFLPYAFVGLALGRADVTNAASVTYTAFDAANVLPPRTVNVTNVESKPGTFGYGYTLGLGFDWMVWSCLFVRAEWESVQFVQFGNQRISLNSIRAGVGWKF